MLVGDGAAHEGGLATSALARPPRLAASFESGGGWVWRNIARGLALPAVEAPTSEAALADAVPSKVEAAYGQNCPCRRRSSAYPIAP